MAAQVQGTTTKHSPPKILEPFRPETPLGVNSGLTRRPGAHHHDMARTTCKKFIELF